MSDKVIRVNYLARVEGEGSLTVRVQDRQVRDVHFTIFEPPRFFEAFLRGRSFREAPDITARICGICPVAYQMSSSQAMEDACDVRIDPSIRRLRRLMYCGEWIESHVLHVAMLHAPDFLGVASAIELAKDHPDIVRQALRLKKIGNDIMTIIGGREIHPVNVGVGGFYRAPEPSQLQVLLDDLTWARDTSAALVRWSSQLRFPDYEADYEFVALSHPDEYAITEGRLRSSSGLDIAISDYEAHFEEVHEPHSHALHSVMRNRGAYLVGPLARYHLNFERLHQSQKDLAEEVHCVPPVGNPFKSIVVRCLETHYAVEEAIRLIQNYQKPEVSMIPVRPKGGRGYGCTEAPRGLCWHRYTLADDGAILDAKIVPPTAQNQKRIEQDLRQFVERNITLPKDQLTWRCEQIVRNYDPCISCATHFLNVHITEEP